MFAVIRSVFTLQNKTEYEKGSRPVVVGIPRGLEEKLRQKRHVYSLWPSTMGDSSVGAACSTPRDSFYRLENIPPIVRNVMPLQKFNIFL
jgi:hypothetical protein